MNKQIKLGPVLCNWMGYNIRQCGSWDREGRFNMESIGIYAGKNLIESGYKTKAQALAALKLLIIKT